MSEPKKWQPFCPVVKTAEEAIEYLARGAGVGVDWSHLPRAQVIVEAEKISQWMLANAQRSRHATVEIRLQRPVEFIPIKFNVTSGPECVCVAGRSRFCKAH